MMLRLTAPSFPEIIGVVVGGCISKPDLREAQVFGRSIAHAHSRTATANFGWICIRKRFMTGYTLGDASDGFDGVVTTPNATLLHEYAHLLTPDHRHDKTWKMKMKELGQSIPRHYGWLDTRPKPPKTMIIKKKIAATDRNLARIQRHIKLLNTRAKHYRRSKASLLVALRRTEEVTEPNPPLYQMDDSPAR